MVYRSRMKYFLKKHIDDLAEPVSNLIIGYKLDVKGIKESDIYQNGGFDFDTAPDIWYSYCHGHNGINSDPDPDHTYLGLTFSGDLTMERVAEIIRELEADEDIQETRGKLGESCSKDIRITSYLYDTFPRTEHGKRGNRSLS
jgi:hypothetical protein